MYNAKINRKSNRNDVTESLYLENQGDVILALVDYFRTTFKIEFPYHVTDDASVIDVLVIDHETNNDIFEAFFKHEQTDLEVMAYIATDWEFETHEVMNVWETLKEMLQEIDENQTVEIAIS
ncbi:hypothetical protein G7062_01540 [Erysipelothrix sp. HDW6C]|uniref:hypothetical protein n=1 Tax=Erysipelothrix sp. HDW6C TaxID=2714930 RepID=UPI00140BDF64|nr:hypothetical protein [Erysipelothrix sp. HDW6C]QIK69043.1 hypothetical protein G7062_01540 [Erysipelothrix sp. HDW6C]